MIKSIAKTVSTANRKRKYCTFNELFKPQQSTTLLDVGFTEKEYREGDNFIEKNYPYKDKITALGIVTSVKQFTERYPEVNVVTYDGKTFPFEHKSFDICWSNAVIEHVGNFDCQLNFLKEIKRVSKKAFITTPNKFFPIEVHTLTFLLHFILSKNQFDKYLRLKGKNWATGNYMHLLSIKDIKNLLEAAGIERYKILANRMFFFVMDFAVYIEC